MKIIFVYVRFQQRLNCSRKSLLFIVISNGDNRKILDSRYSRDGKRLSRCSVLQKKLVLVSWEMEKTETFSFIEGVVRRCRHDWSFKNLWQVYRAWASQLKPTIRGFSINFCVTSERPRSNFLFRLQAKSACIVRVGKLWSNDFLSTLKDQPGVSNLKVHNAGNFLQEILFTFSFLRETPNDATRAIFRLIFRLIGSSMLG